MRTLILDSFPRGQRIIRFDCRVASVERIRYMTPDSHLVEMDTRAYLLNGDRLILAEDVWPRTHPACQTVWIDYTSVSSVSRTQPPSPRREGSDDGERRNGQMP